MTTSSSSSDYGSYGFFLKATNLQVSHAIGLSVRRVQVLRKECLDLLGNEDGAEDFAGQMSARFINLRIAGKLPQPAPVVTYYFPKKGVVHV